MRPGHTQGIDLYSMYKGGSGWRGCKILVIVLPRKKTKLSGLGSMEKVS